MCRTCDKNRREADILRAHKEGRHPLEYVNARKERDGFLTVLIIIGICFFYLVILIARH